MERLECWRVWGQEVHGGAGNVSDKTVCSALRLYELSLQKKVGRILTQEEAKPKKKKSHFFKNEVNNLVLLIIK